MIKGMSRDDWVAALESAFQTSTDPGGMSRAGFLAAMGDRGVGPSAASKRLDAAIDAGAWECKGNRRGIARNGAVKWTPVYGPTTKE